MKHNEVDKEMNTSLYIKYIFSGKSLLHFRCEQLIRARQPLTMMLVMDWMNVMAEYWS